MKSSAVGGAQLKIRKFEPTLISHTSKLMFIGSTDSGKTFAMRHILSRFTDIPVGMVISGTEFANHNYSKMVPGKFISDKYTPEQLFRFVRRQAKLADEKEKGTDLDNRAFLIMDDCLHDAPAWKKDEFLKFIFYAGRHIGTFFMLSSQYPLGIPPDMRGNLQFVFLFREPFLANRRRLYENYAGFFPSFELFCDVMDQLTEDYGCLVLNMKTKSNKLSDQVFWWKAEETPPFRLCAPEHWIDNRPYKSSLAIADGDDDEMEAMLAARRRRGPAVYVKKEKF
jgi:hypothetical protein